MMQDNRDTRNFFNQFQNTQTAVKPGGVARAIAFARGLSGSTVLVAGMVLAAQVLAPQGSKPSDIIGAFHGSTESAEMKAKQEVAVQYEREIANARAAPGAGWTMEAQIAQTQQQVVSDSLQAQSTAANVADGVCMLSGLATVFMGDNNDGRNLEKAMKSTCGEGDKIRRNMTDALSRAGRTGSSVMQRTLPGAAPLK